MFCSSRVIFFVSFLLYLKVWFVENKCLMRGEFNSRLNYFYNETALPLQPEGEAIFKQYCSTLLPSDYINGTPIHTCCSTKQLVTFKSSLSLLQTVIPNCGICRANVQTLTCFAICQPNQDQFATVRFSSVENNTIDSFSFRVSKMFARGLYNSCKDVKFPNSLMSIMLLVCVDGQGECTPEKFVRSLLSHSKFNISAEVVNENDKTTLNIDPLKCNEPYTFMDRTHEGCNCQDCDASCESLFRVKTEVYLIFQSLTIYQFVLISIYGLIVLSLGIFCGYFIVKFHRNIRHSLTPSIGSSDEEDPNQKIEISQNLSIQPTTTITLEERINLKFRAGLKKWVSLVTTYKITVVVISICTLFILSCGILVNFEVSSDPIEIWSSPNGLFRRHKDFFDHNFGPFYRTEQILIKTPNLQPKSAKVGDVNVMFGRPFEKHIMKEIFKIQHDIESIIISSTSDSTQITSNITIRDICHKALQPLSDSCTILSVTQYFQNDVNNLELEDDGYDWRSHIYYCMYNPGSIRDVDVQDLSCLSNFLAPLNPKLIFGDYEDNPEEANVFVITYIVNNYHDEALNKNAKLWERALIDYLKGYSHPEIKLSFNSERSIQDEIDRQSNAEIVTVCISYTLMFLYVSLTLGRIRFSSIKELLIEQKFFLGFMGVCLVLSSVIASIGLYCYFGFKVNMIVLEVLPFLALAIGVDNIFLMVCELESVKNNNGSNIEPADMVGEMLANVGHGMIINAVAQITTFAIGALSNIPAVKNFSIFAATTLFINFSMQFTLFLVVLTWDEIRRRNNRLSPCCCIVFSTYQPSNREDILIIEKLFKILSKFILNKWIRPIVVILFISLWFWGAFHIPSLKIGLEQTIALPADSYLLDYFSDVFSFLKTGPPVYFMISPGFAYEDSKMRKLICSGRGCSQKSLTSVIYDYSRVPRISKIATAANSWVDTYLAWLGSENSNSCCRYRKDSKTNSTIFCSAYSSSNYICQPCFTPSFLSPVLSNEKFAQFLPWFLSDIPVEQCPLGGKPTYGSSVVLNDNYYNGNDSSAFPVYTSSFMAYHTPLTSSDDLIEATSQAMKISNELSDVIGHPVIPYSVFYVYYESYFTIWHETWLSFGISFTAILIVNLFLYGFSIRMTLLMTFLTFIMNVVNAGFMYLLGININPVSLVNLIMFIGINVEFLSHIGRAYISANHSSRIMKARTALIRTGSSTFRGITMTKLIGILVLGFSSSLLFRVYYFQMYVCAILVGSAHGLIALPVILSYIGSKSSTQNPTPS